MTDGDALLAAVIASPDEDTPRLVYADWLEENGRAAWAEFIRVQVALARAEADEEPVPGDVPEEARAAYRAGQRVGFHREASALASLTGQPCRCVLCLRERAYGAWHSLDRLGIDREWFPVLDASQVPPGDRPFALVRRGFWEAVRCAGEEWLARGDAVRAAQPATRVVLTTQPELRISDDDSMIDFAEDLGGPVFSPRDVMNARLGNPEYLFLNDLEIVLRLRWPGVTFELSSTTTNVALNEMSYVPVAPNYNDMVDAQLTDVVQSLTVPADVLSPPPG